MITDYASLQTTVGDFLNRADLASVVPVFIQLAEAEVVRNLRHWRMEQIDTAAISARYSDLPDGWRETVRIEVGGKRLELIPHPDLQKRRDLSGDAAGAPKFYAFTAGQLEVFPSPDGEYTAEHVYFGGIPALSDSTTTNWLLDDHPDVYLYGALLHSAPYLVEDARLPVWRGLYAEALIATQKASDKARASGTLRIRR